VDTPVVDALVEQIDLALMGGESAELRCHRSLCPHIVEAVCVESVQPSRVLKPVEPVRVLALARLPRLAHLEHELVPILVLLLVAA
jgi:hypothetical protein